MEIKQKPALAQSLKVIHSVVNLEFISFISAGETKKKEYKIQILVLAFFHCSIHCSITETLL